MNFTNPRWRTAAILKTVKSPYLCNRVTDFDEIWHGDACWSPAPDVGPKVQIFKFRQSYMADRCHQANRKTALTYFIIRQ